MDLIGEEDRLREIKQNLLRFVTKTNKEMKELGIKSLNISNSDAELENDDVGKLRIYFGKDNINEIDNVESEHSKRPITIKNKQKPFLTSPAITMAKNLRVLLLHINKLPDQQFMMNPIKFVKIESYIQFLLNRLGLLTKEEFEAEIEDLNNSNFLKIDLPNINLEGENLKIISEVNLLKMEDTFFDRSKEETIKILVSQLVKIYDKVLQEHVEAEINRRNIFRNYIDFLYIYRKIEIYCNIYKIRAKGETIKNQTNVKIIEYSSRRIKSIDLSLILKAAKRIERLVNLSNKNWGIVDMFPNLEVSFFKSSSVSVAAYESWLKIIETGEMISEEQGYEIYQERKKEENLLRENTLKQVYESAGCYFSEHGDSPKYYDDEESPRYYPDDEDSSILMDED